MDSCPIFGKINVDNGLKNFVNLFSRLGNLSLGIKNYQQLFKTALIKQQQFFWLYFVIDIIVVVRRNYFFDSHNVCYFAIRLYKNFTYSKKNADFVRNVILRATMRQQRTKSNKQGTTKKLTKELFMGKTCKLPLQAI